MEVRACILTSFLMAQWSISDTRKSYKVLSDSSVCPGHGRLTDESDCESAASYLGLVYRHLEEWNGDQFSSACVVGSDGNVYFNTGAVGLTGNKEIISTTIIPTYGGNAYGANCVFPYMHNETCYTDCTEFNNLKPLELWCSTTAVYSGVWGYCQSDSCGDSGILTSNEGILVSPGYPDRYTSNLDCRYHIHTTLPMVVVTILEFSLEYSSQCTYDYLEIAEFNSSRTIVRLCGDLLGTLGTSHISYSSFTTDTYTAHSSFIVHFHTDANTQKDGFKLKWGSPSGTSCIGGLPNGLGMCTSRENCATEMTGHSCPQESDICCLNECDLSNGNKICPDGSCVPQRHSCDGPSVPTYPSLCPSSGYMCADGSCVYSSSGCWTACYQSIYFDVPCYDSYGVCAESQVECPCRFGPYRCTSGRQCYHEVQFCDGIFDCQDKSDEKGPNCQNSRAWGIRQTPYSWPFIMAGLFIFIVVCSTGMASCKKHYRNQTEQTLRPQRLHGRRSGAGSRPVHGMNQQPANPYAGNVAMITGPPSYEQSIQMSAMTPPSYQPSVLPQESPPKYETVSHITTSTGPKWDSPPGVITDQRINTGPHAHSNPGFDMAGEHFVVDPNNITNSASGVPDEHTNYSAQNEDQSTQIATSHI